MSNVKGNLRSKACLRSKFKQLIENLRNRTLFKQQIKDLIKHPTQQQQQMQQINDIVPVTQITTSKQINSNENESNSSDNSSNLIRTHIKELKNMKDIQEHIDQEIQHQSMYQLEMSNRFLVNQITDLLRPQEKLQLPKNEGRTGCIRRQRFTPSKAKGLKQPKYSKIPRISQKEQKQQVPKALISKGNSIKQLNEIQVIKYWNSSKKINEDSPMQEMYQIFTQLIDTLNIKIREPLIKKYKNCAYFGATPPNYQQYQGFIYYYKHKMYYGELLDGSKHGKGTEINFEENTIYSGTFENGKKNGFFRVQKERENYQGTLSHGIYQGEGRLVTQDSVYMGTFQKGKKHGFGQEYYPKTGLKLKGCFKNGQYQNLDKSKILTDSNSEAEPKNKVSKVVTKNTVYDIDLQLQNTFKRQIEGSFYNKQMMSNVKSSLKPQQNSLEDSKSLYDILTNRNRTNKYDYSIESNMQFPKVKLQGIHTYYKESNPQLKKKEQLGMSRLDSPMKRRYHSQQQKSAQSAVEIDLPLSKHKAMLPIK